MGVLIIWITILKKSIVNLRSKKEDLEAEISTIKKKEKVYNILKECIAHVNIEKTEYMEDESDSIKTMNPKDPKSQNYRSLLLEPLRDYERINDPVIRGLLDFL